MTKHEQEFPEGAIAIVGMAGRFPGAPSIEDLWSALSSRGDTITRIFDGSGTISRAGGRIDQLDGFDRRLFGTSQRETEYMDPQQRMFLEACWNALENAGRPPRSTRARVGLFGGVGISSYYINQVLPTVGVRSDRTFLDDTTDMQLLLGLDKEYAVGRVAYILGLTGPVVAVQGACATGLFAVHQAAQALLGGECDIALAGAASASVPQMNRHGADEGMVLARDGYCRAFDAMSSGSVFSSGTAVVALRLLEDAVADGDPIRAVILGSAIGNDGSEKAGLTAPSSRGQAQVIHEAMRAAGVGVNEVDYVEAHGTGTPVGDPIEIAGLSRAFAGRDTVPLRVGTGKPSLGHLGTAAGIAALVRTTLMLEHRTLLGIRHLTTPNPEIDLGPGILEFQRRDEMWPGGGARARRIAGISAFGLGGFNAHVVIAEAPEQVVEEQSDNSREWLALPVSAASTHSLDRRLDALRSVDKPAYRVARTLTDGREKLPHRRVVVTRRSNLLPEALAGVISKPRSLDENSRLTLLFTGHSPRQPWHLGQLMKHAPFCDTMSEVESALHSLFGWSMDAIGSGRVENLAAQRPLAVGQPLQFLTQVGLFRLWQSWGIRPDALLGHSLGEFAAACAAEVFDVETGLRMVSARGALLENQKGDGAMAALAIDAEEFREMSSDLNGRKLKPVTIAVRNARDAVVVSGPIASVTGAIRWVEDRGGRARALGFGTAGHSEYVDSLLADLRQMIGQPLLKIPTTSYVSSMTGKIESEAVAGSDYWVEQLRAPVEFAAAVETLAQHGPTATLEIGPSNVLSAFVADELGTQATVVAQSLAKGRGADEQLVHAAAALYEHGLNIELSSVNGVLPRPLPLPGYCFDRTRHWLGEAEVVSSSGATAITPLEESWHVDSSAFRAPALPGVWIVVGQIDGSVANEVSNRLRTEGHSVVRVPIALEGGGPAVAKTVAKVIHKQSEPVSGLLCFVGQTDGGTNSVTADWEKRGRKLLRATVALMRVLGAGDEPPLRSWWFAAGTKKSTAMSVSVGMLRSLAREDPDLLTYRVELDLSNSVADSVASVMDAITRSDEAETKYSARTRFVRRLVPLELSPESARMLRSDGTYLVIGSGGLGIVTVQHLLNRGAGRVVIASRHAPETWDSMALLKRFGLDAARVEVVRTDLACARKTTDLVKRIERHQFPLRGVVHAAIELSDALLSNITETDLGRVADVKAKGAAHLLDAVAGCNIDFVTFYSSATAVVGNTGQSVYAAVSTYVDALVAEYTGATPVVQSIAWAPWKDVGHLAHEPGVLASLESAGMGSIDTQQGVEFLDRFLARKSGVIAALANDWSQWALGSRPSESRAFEGLRPNGSNVATSASEANQVGEATRLDIAALSAEEVTAQVVRAARSVLGTQMKPDSSLREEGLDSLSAVQLRNELGAALGRHMRVDVCLRLDSPTAIAEFLMGERNGRTP